MSHDESASVLRRHRRVRARACCSAAALVSLIAFGCSQDKWGTPEYFERILGAKFSPAAPVVTCSDDSGPGVLAFRLVQLPSDVAEKVRASVLQEFPRQLSSQRQRKLQRWTSGPLSNEAREALELALSGAITAIEHSRCRTLKPEQIRQQVRASIAKDTSWYSYEFKAAGGRVVPDELEFRVLDPIERVLYELVNFS